MADLVTQKDLAEATGLSQPTVSLALRDDPRISEKTRQKVLRTARRLGYFKDPMLTALASYRENLQEKGYHGTLAWLNDPEVYKLKSYSDSAWLHYREGAQQQALKSGYRLENFEVDMQAPNQRRLSDILYNRGIEGVILPPLLHPGPALKLEWKHFAAVTFGWSVTEPRFHSVCPNHYYNASEIVRNLHALGYRRVAAIISLGPKEIGKFNHHLWPQGFEISVLGSGLQKLIPTLRLRSSYSREAELLQAWYLQYRPDAVAVLSDYTPFVENTLKEIGVHSPRDIGIAQFSCLEQERYYAGIHEHPQSVGAAAVDVLVGAIRRREFGVPEVRRMLQLESVWKDGQTVRKQTKRTGRA
ncbi:LacI family DNA-binding transcriptional regulator [Ruficoccus sp. ZRK36]|uniref:LacI family DNA-binding transcriptional regulator n=1 Tax=Ruficoccus sp. ZRK36 TaxID=2866311 RepID=UPI001C73372A|nr:LacI family DNA-binding transcriptional regulator [Ruficoccus sp. ZRK36]QYY34418.1 LacI family transcriptional regulator [Ruficoccus sp. ZRK36]